MWWFFNRRMTQDDIEGRCEECGTRLPLTLKVIHQYEIRLIVSQCPEHPGAAHILWPQREDIERWI
jgi:uncharacterized Zn finger protein